MIGLTIARAWPCEGVTDVLLIERARSERASAAARECGAQAEPTADDFFNLLSEP